MSQVRKDFLILLGWIGAGATITVVFGLILVPAIWTLSVSPQPGCDLCGSPPFAFGNPVGPTLCPATDAATVGCLSVGDYVYTVTIESSSIEFGQVYFRVLNSSGVNYSASTDGGFNVLDESGQTVAAFNLTSGGTLSMVGPSQWTFFTAGTGVSSSTPFTSLYSVVVDMGKADPGGKGCSLIAVLTGPEAGSTSELTLP